ncbi:Beta-fructofuranosidase insoluble isoenzyme 1 [Bienertia sinuspersici]
MHTLLIQNHWTGPMIYKGVYHFFYQYNPKGATWGNIVWAHSVSKDLINWEAVEPAMQQSMPFDINGVWSGSATILPDNRPVMLYTGVNAVSEQVQNIAIPANLSDPYLRKWVKPDYNPIITPSSDMNTSYFRDPTTAWWSQGQWKILVGGQRKHRGMAHLYRSRDFRKWIKAKHPLHSAPNTGMWECPDFFPVSTRHNYGLDTSSLGQNMKHVLKVSLDVTRFEYYTIGNYDPIKDRYYPDNVAIDGWNGLRYDYGNFYASKSFFDSQKERRILWGWANESWSPDTASIKGWAGIQADVEVAFRIPSLEKAEAFDPKWVNPQDLCAEMGSTVRGGVGPFGLLTLASNNLEEYTPIFFRVFKAQNNNHVVLMCSDASSSSMDKGLYRPTFGGFVDVDLGIDKKLSLRTLIDHSVVESFGGGGKTCILSRIYPTLAIMNKAHLHVFNNGTDAVIVEHLSAWTMRRPFKMNN